MGSSTHITESELPVSCMLSGVDRLCISWLAKAAVTADYIAENAFSINLTSWSKLTFQRNKKRTGRDDATALGESLPTGIWTTFRELSRG